ncbi:hypothetical protein ABZ646_23395 [Streptomyces sp. NPDC007162]
MDLLSGPLGSDFHKIDARIGRGRITSIATATPRNTLVCCG